MHPCFRMPESSGKNELCFHGVYLPLVEGVLDAGRGEDGEKDQGRSPKTKEEEGMGYMV
jgi:hypothetical protein